MAVVWSRTEKMQSSKSSLLFTLFSIWAHSSTTTIELNPSSLRIGSWRSMRLGTLSLLGEARQNDANTVQLLLHSLTQVRPFWQLLPQRLFFSRSDWCWQPTALELLWQRCSLFICLLCRSQQNPFEDWKSALLAFACCPLYSQSTALSS